MSCSRCTPVEHISEKTREDAGVATAMGVGSVTANMRVVASMSLFEGWTDGYKTGMVVKMQRRKEAADGRRSDDGLEDGKRKRRRTTEPIAPSTR